MKYYEDEVRSLLKNDDDLHLIAGLSAETGEVAAIFQKSSYKSVPIDLEHLKEELGDVLFYTTAIATKYNLTIEELISYNINKLNRRHKK